MKFLIKSAGCVIGLLAFSGCTDSVNGFNDDQVFGQVTSKSSQAPIVGATVSYDGVEANDTTDERGEYTVSGLDTTDTSCHWLTVNAQGFVPFAEQYRVVEGNRLASCASSKASSQADVQMQPNNAPGAFDIGSPAAGANLVKPEVCENPRVWVDGLVDLDDVDTFLYDVMVVVDRSSSTSETFDNSGLLVLNAEVNAAKVLLDSLDARSIRAGLATYASDVQVLDMPGTDIESLRAGLDQITPAGHNSSGATATGAAIRAATDALTALPPRCVSVDENGDCINVTPKKAIVLLTDGVPTLPEGSGDTQEPGDRQDTIDAAKRSGDAGIPVFPVVIDPQNEANRRLTTMPAVQAVSGAGGSLRRVSFENAGALTQVVESLPLSGAVEVMVSTDTGNSVSLLVQPDGRFSGFVPVTDSTSQITLQAHSGNPDEPASVATTVLDIRVSPAATDYASIAESQTVSEIAQLLDPYRQPLKGNKLHNFLKNGGKAYPDAKPVFDVSGYSLASERLGLAWLFQSTGGWTADFGYFTFDPDNPPADAAAALSSATVLFNSKDMPQGNSGSKDVDVMAELSLPSPNQGETFGFFLLPDQKGGKGNKKDDLPPIFTLPGLNDGGFWQHLSYFDQDSGRLVISFERVALSHQRNDHDYADIIIAIDTSDPVEHMLDCE